MSDIQHKLAQLLASNAVSAETKQDLRGFEDDLGNGRLDSKDQDYILALHRRLLSGERDDASAAPPDEETGTIDWKERAAAERSRAERAEARVKQLEERLADIERKDPAI